MCRLCACVSCLLLLLLLLALHGLFAEVKQLLDDGVAWGFNQASCEEFMPDHSFSGQALTEQDGWRFHVIGESICALGFPHTYAVLSRELYVCRRL
jgi:hypothetical protein